jgi:hypothetical protein
MHFFRAFHQAEARAKFIVQGFGVVPDNIQAATFCRALWSEGTHDDVPARFYGSGDLTNV